jgi:ABC-type Fe3+ transport system substrate-binding protein
VTATSADTGLRPYVDAARGHDRLVARGLTDPGSMEGVIWPAFVADVAPWAGLDYDQDVSAGRLLGTVSRAAADARPDVVIVSDPALFDRAGLVEPFGVPEPAAFPRGWLDTQERWFPIYVQPIVAIHNAHRAAPPRTWDDLAATPPARLALDDPARMLTSGPALAELSAALEPARWDALLATIAHHDTLLVADNERAVLEVSTGSRWAGLANWNVARRIRPGSPVRHVFLQPTPCVPGFGVLLRDGRAKPLARLFLAWLATPAGQRAYAASGRIPARPDVDARPSIATVLPSGVEPLYGGVPWLTESDAWAARFRELIPAERDGVREGKLRRPA